MLIPLAMLPAIHAATEEERLDPQDVVRDALERHLEDREWNKIFAYGEAQARALGLTEEDVPRLIAEARAERRHGRA
jgi:hypothetical protein